MKIRTRLKFLWSSLCLVLALLFLFAPIWLAFSRDITYLFLFFVSWVPAGALIQVSEIFD